MKLLWRCLHSPPYIGTQHNSPTPSLPSDVSWLGSGWGLSLLLSLHLTGETEENCKLQLLQHIARRYCKIPGLQRHYVCSLFVSLVSWLVCFIWLVSWMVRLVYILVNWFHWFVYLVGWLGWCFVGYLVWLVLLVSWLVRLVYFVC